MRNFAKLSNRSLLLLLLTSTLLLSSSPPSSLTGCVGVVGMLSAAGAAAVPTAEARAV